MHLSAWSAPSLRLVLISHISCTFCWQCRIFLVINLPNFIYSSSHTYIYLLNSNVSVLQMRHICLCWSCLLLGIHSHTEGCFYSRAVDEGFVFLMCGLGTSRWYYIIPEQAIRLQWNIKTTQSLYQCVNYYYKRPSSWSLVKCSWVLGNTCFGWLIGSQLSPETQNYNNIPDCFSGWIHSGYISVGLQAACGVML